MLVSAGCLAPESAASSSIVEPDTGPAGPVVVAEREVSSMAGPRHPPVAEPEACRRGARRQSPVCSHHRIRDADPRAAGLVVAARGCGGRGGGGHAGRTGVLRISGPAALDTKVSAGRGRSARRAWDRALLAARRPSPGRLVARHERRRCRCPAGPATEPGSDPAPRTELRAASLPPPVWDTTRCRSANLVMTEPVARLRIELREIGPRLWRRVDVPLSSTLLALHDIIQIAVGWTDSICSSS